MAFKSSKSAKAKGRTHENDVAKALAEASGIDHTRRQPGSGAIQGFKGDVLHDPRGWELSVECKHHASIPNYDRLEKARLLKDGVFVDTPAGEFYWLTDEYWLEMVARAYGRGGAGLNAPALGSLKTGRALTSFDNWMKGCDVLVVKPNHRPQRWYVPSETFWQAVNFAARAEFYIEPEAA